MADARPARWPLVALALGLAAAVLGYLHLVVGVELDAPTVGLALACAALIGALRGMWGVVFVLSRPSAETLAELGGSVSNFGSKAELREEKQRVLRAIKELEFDHAMGKLSDADFKQVGDAYRVRAIEVMRALDEGDNELHPLLREHLAELGALRVEPAPASAPAEVRA